MLNCNQCGADYSEQGLDNGRCRQCGYVIRWSSTAMPSTAMAWPSDAPLAPTPPVGLTPTQPGGGPHGDEMQVSEPGMSPAVPMGTIDLASFQAQPADPSLAIASPATVGSVPRTDTDPNGSPESKNDQTKRNQGRTRQDAGEASDEVARVADLDPDEPTEADPSSDTRRSQNLTLNNDSNLAKLSPQDVADQWETISPEEYDVSSTIAVDAVEDATRGRLLVPRRSVRQAADEHGAQTDYELIEVIGRGGEGVVHAARQASIDRTVALKMIRKGRAESPDARNKFLSEAVVTGELEHPNIVPIYDLGATNDGSPFYVMKRIEGTPWSEVIGKQSLAENLSILLRTADAVGLAHSRGVVHRDLKPENIMLGEFGEVLLTDWGIALCTEDFAKHSSVITTRGLGGTPAYMAPEMATGPVEKIGPQSDVYLLGAILYEMVTGKAPHHAKSVMSCLHAAANNEIQPTSERGELVDIARKAMATDPRARYESVKDFQNAIVAYQSHSESVTLADQAKQDLECARDSHDYKDYATALFGFQKAVELWEGNREAKKQLIVAANDYASEALKKGDLDLASSLLDSSQRQHHRLREQIGLAQSERAARAKRFQRMRYTAFGLVLAIFSGGTFAFLHVLAARRNAENARILANEAAVDAKLQAGEAERQRLAAVEASQLAVQREAEAKRARQDAEIAAQKANDERKRSDTARMETVAALRRAKVASYGAAISLAAGSIVNNAFSEAKSILEQQYDHQTTTELCHWEWGRLMYRCLGGDPEVPETLAAQTIELPSESTAVAVSADQRRLACSTITGEIELWQANPGPVATPDSQPYQPGNTTKRTWTRMPGLVGNVPINDVALSPDGSLIAAAGSDGMIRVHRLDEREVKPLLLRGHKFEVHSVAFSPDAKSNLLASASADRTIRIWDTNTGELVRTLVGHTDAVWSVAFSDQADRLVTASQDSTARVWSAQTGAELQRFREHEGAVFCAAFSPDGSKIASGGYDRKILIWPADQFQPVEGMLVDEVIKRLDVDKLAATEARFEALKGHAGAIRDLDFSRDGKKIISAARDNTLRVWDTPTKPRAAKILNTLRGIDDNSNDSPQGASVQSQEIRGHGGWVTGCDFLDTDHVVSVSYDGSIKFWTLSRYQPLLVLDDVTRPVLSADYAPDGQTVALAFDDGTAGVWKVESGERIARLEEGHDFLAIGGEFLPDGNRLVTVAGDNTTRLWNVQSGSQVWSATGTGRRGLLTVSKNGDYLVTGSSDGKIPQLHRMSTGEKVRDFGVAPFDQLAVEYPQAKPEEIAKLIPDLTAVSYSPDGLKIATAYSSGVCKIWAIDQAEPLLEVRGHNFPVTSLKWSPDSGTLFTASVDSSVAFWDSQSGEELAGRRLVHEDAVSLLSISSDGKRALTVSADGTGSQQLQYWDLDRRELLARYPEQRPSRTDLAEQIGLPELSLQKIAINSIAFSADGNKALVATFDIGESRYEVQQWDLNTGTLGTTDLDVTNELSLRAGVVLSALYAKRSPQALFTIGGKGARYWNQQDGRELMNYRPHGSVLSVDYSADGQRIVTTGSDQTLKVWKRDAETDQWLPESKILSTHQGAIYQAKFAGPANSVTVISVGQDGRAIVWEQNEDQSWQSTQTFAGHTKAIRSLSLSPDGRLMATASSDHSVRLWDLTNGESLGELLGHRGEVLCVAFTPDSKRLISGGSDNQAIVWNVEQQQLITRLGGHSASINAVTFSPDGRRAVTGSQDNIVKLWDTSEATLSSSDSGKKMLSLSDHDRQVMSVQFSPDGRKLLSVGRDAKALIYHSVSYQ